MRETTILPLLSVIMLTLTVVLYYGLLVDAVFPDAHVVHTASLVNVCQVRHCV
jgi:hypothetical protein